MCNWRERFVPTAGAAASTVSQKIGRIERASAQVCLTPNRGRGCGRAPRTAVVMVMTTVLKRIGSRRTCETIWILQENESRVERLSHGVFICLLLIGLHVVSDRFPRRYETAVDDLVCTSVNLRRHGQAIGIIPVTAWMLLPSRGQSVYLQVGTLK
jgi:hypothetical protein